MTQSSNPADEWCRIVKYYDSSLKRWERQSRRYRRWYAGEGQADDEGMTSQND